MADQIDSLVNQTMDMSRTSHARDPFAITQNLKKERPNSSIKESGSGILYTLDRNSNSFCVKCFPVRNLNLTLANTNSLSCKNSPLANFFSKGENIFSFPTAYFELAEIISDQISNRRFPIDEDIFYNISDPGHSWWMNYGSNWLKIHYKSFSVDKNIPYIKLGPLGDQILAAKRFYKIRSSLENLFPIEEFACNEQSFFIKTLEMGHENFSHLKSIFHSGNILQSFDECARETFNEVYYRYIHELSATRLFWIELEKILTN